MNVDGYDHINIQIPEDRVDDCVAFYWDTLGFEPEDLAEYRSGDRPIFGFWLSDNEIIHIRPVSKSADGIDTNYGHAAVRVHESIDDIRERVESSDGRVVRESNPKGATGRARAVYVEDPFGFQWEFKTAQ